MPVLIDPIANVDETAEERKIGEAPDPAQGPEALLLGRRPSIGRGGSPELCRDETLCAREGGPDTNYPLRSLEEESWRGRGGRQPEQHGACPGHRELADSS